MVSLSIAIITHPARLPYAMGLQAELNDQIERSPNFDRFFTPSLVVDDYPGGWYPRQGLRAANAFNPNATHHLVIEDDIELTPRFLDTALKILEALESNNLEVVLTFMSFAPVTATLQEQGHRWIYRDTMSGFWATILPIELWQAVYDWGISTLEFTPGRPRPMFETLITFYHHFVIKKPCRVYIPIPNLVQHLELESLLGHKYFNKPRTSPTFKRVVTDTDDPFYLDWSKDITEPVKISGYSLTKFYKMPYWRNYVNQF
ncbi:MAG: hypothetical protein HXX08_11230 [Chloroflexi bacterium]|uniref:Uncharacterized protein n=1 Tax=Candidatus Chlorohelix allophototropha TaxID=3003348 RepID=A0A8T7M2S7_9CHLR|nr:hypothetical protein [Chloroflexota bacterium]WJW65809.1 hypothetical protein OZ401_001588 [Chloroflexota bacterium L227-S17]